MAAGPESRNESRRMHAGSPLALALRAAALGALVCMAAAAGDAQDQPNQRTPHPILLPEANRLPDVNDRMRLAEQNQRKQNFDAANTERKREMDDDSAKLLLLARDLKLQTDRLEREPLSPKALREIEVIEMLAHDLKEKMKMTVGGA